MISSCGRTTIRLPWRVTQLSNVTLHKFDFKSHIYRDDPWKVFGGLLQHGPLIRMKMPILGTSWGATSYEAVNAVLKNDTQFVRDAKNAGRKNLIRFQWMMPRVFFSLISNMLAADGADHRRLRSVVDQAFNRRNIDGMTGRIEEIAEEHLEMAQRAAASDGTVDLLEHFARPFPLAVICELLGLPEQDREKFSKWFEPLSTVSSIFGIFSLARGMRKVIKYFRTEFETVRKNPREGLLSELVQIEHEGEQLNERELLSMAFLLLVAGHETTVHLISNSILTLLQHPDAKAELLADWSKCDSTIDEVLRYCSPIQLAKPRYVAETMEFYGHQLRRGEMVTPILACANYDSNQFEQPFQFDINRKPNYHMTFGSGPHTCLGMKLARSETRIALQKLFSRWPNLAADFDLEKPEWSVRPGTRGMKSFHVNLNA